jgi:Glycerophosphoryl diester phosphodiesterase family
MKKKPHESDSVVSAGACAQSGGTGLSIVDLTEQGIDFNIEIKMATSDALERTPLHEIQRVVDPIMATIAAHPSERAIAMSSFDPDVMAYVAQHGSALRAHCAMLTTWFLTSGPLALLHKDPRRCSVRAAIASAQGAACDGIVVESSVAQQDVESIVAAIDAGLKVRLHPLAVHRMGATLHCVRLRKAHDVWLRCCSVQSLLLGLLQEACCVTESRYNRSEVMPAVETFAQRKN